MKSNVFREQVTMLISWFKNWSECEQTVAIYSLLKRSSPVQAKFLQQVLHHFLTDCNDIKELEEKANDEEYVRSLRSKEKGVLHQLLHLLPLLQVGKNDAKAAYLELIPDHLSHTILNGVNIEESRQLISFSLIHPAISAEERVPLQSWLVYLDDRFTNLNTSQSVNSNISSNNRLAVGCSSSSSSGGSNNPSHSPSPVSPSHRSISQSSLCPELNQDHHPQVMGNPNMLSPHILPSHGSSSHSPSPTINLWQQQSQQQLKQSQQFHNQSQGHSPGYDTNPQSQNFHNVPSGNFSNNSLVVGGHSTISPAQRSASQSSLCQDSPSSDQVHINTGSSMRPIAGHSPTPAMNLWQQQQLYQQAQGNQSNVEHNPINHSSVSGTDSSGYGQYGSVHNTLRATNSHVGSFRSSQGHMPLKASASAPPNLTPWQPVVCKSQEKTGYSPEGQKNHARLSRTRSVAPPERLQQPKIPWTSRQSGKGGSEHAPLSPQSSVTSSESSDSHHEDGPQDGPQDLPQDLPQECPQDGPPPKDIYREDCSPIQNLVTWLREIRLHKYLFLFRHMTYEELLNLSEEWLLQNNVTRGARSRFMINIEKLQERQSLLKALEKSVMEGGPISLALNEMKVMLITPMKEFMTTFEQQKDLSEANAKSSSSSSTKTHTDSSISASTNEPIGPVSADSSTLTLTTSLSSSSSSSTPVVPSSSSLSSSPQSPSDEIPEGDLPSQFCRLLGKVTQKLLQETPPKEHSFRLYLQLIEKCLKHNAFTAEQKKSLLSRKQAAEKIWNPPPQRYYKPNRSWWGGNTYPLYDSFGSRIIPRSNRAPVPGSQQQQQQWRTQQTQWRQQQQQRHQLYQKHHQPTHGGSSGHQQWNNWSSRPSGMGGHQAVTRNSSWNPAYLKPGLMEPPAKQPLSRTQSAPINRPPTLPIHGIGGDDTEINARLDSLCVRMTEQAIGNSEQGDNRGSTGFSMS